jgi:NADH-quinone oxidoreductase subunit J
MDALFFWIFAVVAIVASVLVVGQRNPMYSVLLLIVSFGALAGLYVLLNAPFMAVLQIIVYAGAIMVLFLFVVMLLNVSSEEEEGNDVKPRFVINAIGLRLFRDYAFAFEATSILILVAMVGAVVIARKER